MASVKSKMAAKERYLADAAISLGKMYQKDTIQNIVLSWRVPCYNELSYGVLHFQVYDSIDIKCTLRLFKKKHSLCVCVSSSTLPKRTKAEFFITDEEKLDIVKNGAAEIAEGVFVSEFQNETFQRPNLSFLKNDVLTLSFKYASNYYVTYKEADMNAPELISDLDALCCDLREMYLEAMHSDFLIHVQDVSFKTHKFILASRSPYFDKVFQNEPSAEDHQLDAIPGIAHEALLYLYSGELRELDFNCMVKLHELAVFLELSTLTVRCKAYFTKNINKENYMALARICGESKEMRNIVARFLQENCPDISIVNVFKQVKEELKSDCK